MDIESAAGHLRHAATPLAVVLPAPPLAALSAALARFESAGARVTLRSAPDGPRLHLVLGPVTLAHRPGPPGRWVLAVESWAEDASSLRIVFRVMASLGRGLQQPVELIAGDPAGPGLFRYRPGGPGLLHVPSGERVAPYDRD